MTDRMSSGPLLSMEWPTSNQSGGRNGKVRAWFTITDCFDLEHCDGQIGSNSVSR